MTARTTRPKCLLLDANIVIEAHEIGIWAKLTAACEIMIPSVVVRDEALFYSKERSGVHEDIDLPRLVEDGRITEVTATSEELAALYDVFDRVFVEEMHPGEAEALSLLKAGRVTGAYYCTADGPVIEALAMLGMAELGISMEMMLGKLGFGRRLRKSWFNEAFFQRKLRSGSIRLVTRDGLADKGPVP